jgi:hypothetical protein
MMENINLTFLQHSVLSTQEFLPLFQTEFSFKYVQSRIPILCEGSMLKITFFAFRYYVRKSRNSTRSAAVSKLTHKLLWVDSNGFTQGPP